MENMKKSLILIYLANEIAFRPLGYYSPLLLMALHYCQNITHLLFKDRPLAPLKEMDLARQIEAEMILVGKVYYTALLKLCNAVTEEMQYLKICIKIVFLFRFLLGILTKPQ